jgi:hypothetical protein
LWFCSCRNQKSNKVHSFWWHYISFYTDPHQTKEHVLENSTYYKRKRNSCCSLLWKVTLLVLSKEKTNSALLNEHILWKNNNTTCIYYNNLNPVKISLSWYTYKTLLLNNEQQKLLKRKFATHAELKFLVRPLVMILIKGNSNWRKNKSWSVLSEQYANEGMKFIILRNWIDTILDLSYKRIGGCTNETTMQSIIEQRKTTG